MLIRALMAFLARWQYLIKNHPNKMKKNKSLFFKSKSRSIELPANLPRLSDLLIFLFIFLLPTQLGKHFFLDFSSISGVRVDYLAPTLYLADVVSLILFWLFRHQIVGSVKKHLNPLLLLLVV